MQQLLLTGWCWGCFPRRALAATCLSRISFRLLNSSENNNSLVTASIVYDLNFQLAKKEDINVQSARNRSAEKRTERHRSNRMPRNATARAMGQGCPVVGCGSAHVFGYHRSSPGEHPTPGAACQAVFNTLNNNLNSLHSASFLRQGLLDTPLISQCGTFVVVIGRDCEPPERPLAR